MDKKRNVLIKEMMNLLDDVKLIRDDITDSYQKAYYALQIDIRIGHLVLSVIL